MILVRSQIKYVCSAEREAKLHGKNKVKEICLYNILVHCEGVDFKVTGIKFMIVFIRRSDAACF